MIRILHVVPNMNRGGLETFIMNVYRNINKDEFQFDFLEHYQEISAYDEEIKSLGGTIYHLSFRNDKNIIKYINDLNRFFDEHKEYQIIHCHMASISAILFIIAKKHGIKIRIAHSHNSATEKTLKGVVKRFLSSFVKYTSTINFACSQLAGQYLFKNKKFEIIPNAIDLEKYQYNSTVRQNLRKEYGLENKFVIGHVGRFCLQKNHDFLIDIFYEYQLKNPRAVLVLVGTGNRENAIKNKVNKLGLNNKVIFLGVRKDVNDLYSMFDLFLFPSKFEGLPLTLVEAEASALPIIASQNISKECVISDKIYFLDIKDKTIWLNKINELRLQKREDVCFNQNKEKFDIKKLTLYLEEKYHIYNQTIK